MADTFRAHLSWVLVPITIHRLVVIRGATSMLLWRRWVPERWRRGIPLRTQRAVNRGGSIVGRLVASPTARATSGAAPTGPSPAYGVQWRQPHRGAACLRLGGTRFTSWASGVPVAVAVASVVALPAVVLMVVGWEHSAHPPVAYCMVTPGRRPPPWWPPAVTAAAVSVGAAGWPSRPWALLRRPLRWPCRSRRLQLVPGTTPLTRLAPMVRLRVDGKGAGWGKGRELHRNLTGWLVV